MSRKHNEDVNMSTWFDPLRVLCWNVEGLRGLLKKEDHLEFSPFHALLLTETFITCEPDEEIVPNYRSFYAEAIRTD